jgi:hypothetical protein
MTVPRTVRPLRIIGPTWEPTVKPYPERTERVQLWLGIACVAVSLAVVAFWIWG